jgi:hypothetical protein
MNKTIAALLAKFAVAQEEDPFYKDQRMARPFRQATPAQHAKSHRGVTKAEHNEKKDRMHRLMTKASRKINRRK